MQEHEIAAVIHHAGTHEAVHEAHELRNIISILNNLFPRAGWAHFLEQWENVIFSLAAAIIISFVFVQAARKNKIIPEGIQNYCEVIVESI